MNFFELFRVATLQLTANKLRSFLTTLGIILGVWFVISIVSVMDAFTESLITASTSLGNDVFQLDGFNRNSNHNRRFFKNPEIRPEYAKRFEEKCSNVLVASPEDSNNGPVIISYLDRKTNPSFELYGASKGFFHNNNWPIGEGREINNADVESGRSVIVIGYSVVKELFYDRSAIGEIVKVEGRSYKVIGVMKEQGNQFGNDRDAQVAIPYSVLHRDFGKFSPRITFQATGYKNRAEAVEEVTNEMRLINKLVPGAEDNFSIWTNEANSDEINNVMTITTVAGAGLGLIALFVGGIGVMNIMLASVKERTREIGIRKSLGARKNTILFQFIFESSFLCVVGGIIGIIAGIGTGALISLVFGNSPVFPVSWTIFAIVATSLIGVGFGSIPAWQAAKLDPIEALRYE
jgi:putative ABC transport system permease protein